MRLNCPIGWRAPIGAALTIFVWAVVAWAEPAKRPAGPAASSPAGSAKGCEGKTGSTWIRCVAAAPEGGALATVLDKMRSYPYLVPEAAAKLALANDPERLLDLAEEAGQPPHRPSGPVTHWSARLRGALAALGALLQRTQSVPGVRVPGDLADRMFAFCVSHVADANAPIAEAAIECIAQMRGERGGRALWQAVEALHDEETVVKTLSLLNERGQPPDPSQARRMIEQIARPLDSDHWSQSQLEQKRLACRLLRGQSTGLDGRQREQIAAMVTVLRPLRSQVADACELLLSVASLSGTRAAASTSTFRPQKLAFDHVVQAAETLSSINARLGGDPFANGIAIYADALNEGFRRANPDPEHLHPGGVLRVADYDGWTSFQLKEQGSQSFRLFFEGIEVEGSFVTDSRGMATITFPPTTGHVQMVLPDQFFRFTFNLAPAESLAGIQGRLSNLGFGAEVTGALDERTSAAIRLFQSVHGLENTGTLNEETRMRIIDEYGN